MCGIVGIWHRDGGRPIDRSVLHAMNESQVHRGPDDGGLFVGEGVGLGHRRLAIRDLSPAGHQPLFNEDGTVAVVYNGEIYNFEELHDELVAAGHVFRSRCDTEAIVHAWEEWGEACVERFRGMFAFGLWDANRRVLFLARDRMGIKPLHYAMLPDGGLIFGSELKSLLRHPRLPREVDPLAVEEYFSYGYIPDPRSIYETVKKLPPGHTLTVRRDRPIPEPRPFWDVRFGTGADASEMIARLKDAVDARLVSDVPLGAFLSGGVDSSAVVAMMARGGRPVDTCSIGFDRADHDETRYAEMVARHFHTNHRTRLVDPDGFDLLDRLSAIYDEPYADSSAIPTLRVCELAREKVTVALSGDGGDELFAGYRRYRWHKYEEMVRGSLPSGVRRPLFGFLGEVYPKADWAPKVLRAKSTFQAIARDTVDGYFHSVSVVSDGVRRQMFSDAFRKRLDGYHASEVLRRHFDAAPTDDALSKVQYADMKTYLPGDILTKVDRASMAVALEVRVPLLDHHFVEWGSALPSSLKLQGREGKAVFKKALEPHLPHDVLYRPKMGFAVPLSAWFRGPLRERVREAVDSPVLADAGLFDREALRRMADQHARGTRDYAAPLWAVMMFEAFLRRTAQTPAREALSA